MTSRTLTAGRPGPVLLAVDLPAGTVNVTADPQVTTATVEIRTTGTDPALAEVIDRAVLRWDDTGALMVKVPDLPTTTTTFTGGGVHIVQNATHVGRGAVITGAVINDGVFVSGGGKVVVNGVTVTGATGTIEITARVPEGSNLDVRGTAAGLDAAGEYGDVTARTISGAVRLDAAHTLTVSTTSGAVHATAVDTAGSVKTVSGSVSVGGFAGTGRFDSVSGAITVTARAAATVAARSVSGDVHVTATDRALAAGVQVQANSVSGHVTTPDTHRPPTGRRSGRVGGDW